jgi:hypothetical protein
MPPIVRADTIGNMILAALVKQDFPIADSFDIGQTLLGTSSGGFLAAMARERSRRWMGARSGEER